MAVEREEFEHPFAHGKVAVPRVVRQANGDWSVEFELNFTVALADGRRIHVTDRHVMVRGVQRGRKPIAAHPGLPAQETSVAPTASEPFCEDCPPIGYPTDATRCTACPRARVNRREAL